MSVIALLVILIILGVVLYFVQGSDKINATIKKILWVVIIAIAILLVLWAFGIWDEVRNVRVPKL